MARTNKVGIDYFSFDVDFFNDDKIQLIEAEFGIKGSIIAIRLLCKIYNEGYFYGWGEDQCLLFAKNSGSEFTPELVQNIVDGLIRRSFFDANCYEKHQILTSTGIQRRYLEATLRYKEVKLIEEYLLIETPNRNNINIISLNVDINPQRKGKEIEIESKVNSIAAPSNFDKARNKAIVKNEVCSIEKKEIEFKKSIQPFIEKYGKNICNNFYLYWTEPNKSKTKLRYEMEKTWDVKRRLANWANRDKTFNAKSNKPIAEPNYQKL